ncbi:MAG: hypothetical protein Q4D56_14235 [Bacteroides sp.]|nr:hypothetical protein [Bacteroides sp.]
MGMHEGVHYVRGKEPPASWRGRCSIIVNDYHYCYSFWNGSVLFLGSLDNPSLLAGKSVVHIFYDEAKFDKDEKVNRAMPILRGDSLSFGASHLFLGMTITTDMPDVAEGEYDWYLRFASQMDPDRIVLIAQAAMQRNDLLIEQLRQQKKPAPSKARLDRLERQIAYYDHALVKLRKGQTYFLNASSLVNVDILTPEYIYNLYNGTLELHEFCKSVLGMRPGLRRDIRFYVLFASVHKYDNGSPYGEPATHSGQLRYLHADQPLDGGMDFGNMLSLVIGQRDGAYYRVHKNLYELPPGWFRELADRFLSFFATHERKELYLYYDRAGNNFEKQKEDSARKIKEAIEKDGDGRRTGWTVTLMSRRQSIIPQAEEYNFMQELMRGDNGALPLLRVDEVNCRELVSSMEKAPAGIRYKGESKVVFKVKKSEKLPPKKLPMLSTNLSDAFKYLMMRPAWRKIARSSRGSAANPYVPGFDD